MLTGGRRVRCGSSRTRPGAVVRPGGRCEADAAQVLVDGGHCGRDVRRIERGVGERARRPFAQRHGDVGDRTGALADAEQQVVLGGRAERRSQPTGRGDDLVAHQGETTQVGLASQAVG